MMRLSLKALAQVVHARTISADAEVIGMIHDTRRVEPGNLFCAIRGDRVDGHDFLEQAQAAGAHAALVSQSVDSDLPRLVVDDVERAMGEIARHWRMQLDLRVVGVTGSNGKTTVKEMLSAIVSPIGKTLATEGNWNNELGVPLTLARLSTDDEFAVIEMGAARAGDIRYLTDLARPEVGIVTNAAPAHLEGFGDVRGVAEAKGEMFETLPISGTAIINADDPHAALWVELAGHCRNITFGLDASADVHGEFHGGLARVTTPSGQFSFTPRLPGRHNLQNALAATAAAVALGINEDQIASGLSGFVGVPGRLQAHYHEAGWCLVDDTYNANPASLYAGLQALTEFGGERWVVLGDMAELGPDSEKLHAEMGQTALDMGISRLFTLGEVSRRSSAVFGRNARHFESIDDLVESLENGLHEGVTCLVKGSRSMGMERVVAGLLGGGR